MRIKKAYYPEESQPNKDALRRMSLDNSFMSVANPGIAIKTESDLELRLNEAEALNKRLTRLLDLRTKKLADVKASNTRFISIIAHDLRSPFNSLIGVLDLLKEHLSDKKTDDFEEYVNIAYESANNALNLVESLLEWAVSQTVQERVSPVRINLLDFLEEEAMNFNATAYLKGIVIYLSIQPGLYVTADLHMLKIVVRNLISNSIKFTNTGGEITLRATVKNGFVEISVKDNGIGISSKRLAELFKVDSFHSTYGTNNEKGSGLGLIICREFLEHTGGSISIESEPGRGCNTIITLPC